MSQITSHVLDTAKGKPAEGISLTLYHIVKGESKIIGSDTTNNDGRSVKLLSKNHKMEAGIYRLHFDLENYFGTDSKAFYPFADITFRVKDAAEHYHIPLLLSPFGYTTYRGS